MKIRDLANHLWSCFLRLLVICLWVGYPLSAFCLTPLANKPFSATTVSINQPADLTTRFCLQAGYRVDQLDWNIAGNNNDNDYVNVLSELSWRDLEIFQVQLQNVTILQKRYYVRFSISKGYIYAGENQDSDYNSNNRGDEWSRSNNSADSGDVIDLSIGAGYRFRFYGDRLGIIPLVGLSQHEQNLNMTDGYQTIGAEEDLGPFQGLDSSYNACWTGPWLGLDVTYTSELPYRWAQQIGFDVGFEYHWADYQATAKWNLRTDFDQDKSFIHNADGTGIVVNGGCRIALSTHWGIQLRGNYQQWRTDAGTDRVYGSNGTVSETVLNEVNWSSVAGLLGVELRF
jgi:hypothetical protein